MELDAVWIVPASTNGFSKRPPPRGSSNVTRAAQAATVAVTLEAVGLGNRSYLLHDGAMAVVVDPQRDPEEYTELAATLGVEITHVLETHIHNDYVSGGLALARATHARYVIPRGVDVEFASECEVVEDGSRFEVGALTVEAIATPGHTPHHLAYVIADNAGEGEYVCTGGAVLPGGVGRTDLFGPDRFRELATLQWHSVRHLLGELQGSTRLLPTHGFGSFCSVGAGAPSDEELTVASERVRNPAALDSLDAFIERLEQAIPPVPTYYRRMADLNRSGMTAPSFDTVPELALDDVERLLESGEVVVDLRRRREFARRHRRGVLNFELGDSLTTYFGWLVDFDARYVLIGESEDDVARARRGFARIGREQLSGYALVDRLEDNFSDSYRVATFHDLARAVASGDDLVVLDTRHRDEWVDGHLDLARHAPLPELTAHLELLDPELAVWVHCAAGYRAAIAASQLAAWGYSPVLVDDVFANAAIAGLRIRSAPVPTTGRGDRSGRHRQTNGHSSA